MADCKSLSPSHMLSSGRSTKSFKKAFNKVMKDLNKKGRGVCLPGNCSEFGGGGCTFNLTSMDAEFRMVEIGGVYEYHVTLDGSGECRCA